MELALDVSWFYSEVQTSIKVITNSNLINLQKYGDKQMDYRE